MTMFPVILTELAKEDILDIAAYLAGQSHDMGIRFFDQVAKTLERLEEMPELGTLCHFENTRVNVRVWPVKGFPNHLFFYRIEPHNATIILRVLHGSTNYDTLFQG